MTGPSRRAVVAAALAVAVATPARSQVRRVRLRRDGAERQLPDPLFTTDSSLSGRPPPDGRSWHEATRTMFAQLADPQLATSTWPGGDVVSWVLRAARAAHYQRLTAEGGVAACLLRQADRRTVLVHNAGQEACVVDLSSLLRPRTQILAECVETPDPDAPLETSGPPHGQLALQGRLVTVPPWSVTRIVWDA